MSEPSPFGNPNAPTSDPTDTADSGVGLPSILDTILDLDEFLSGDVRRAEKSARFATKPDLEADIEDKNAELEALTDGQGKPLPNVDQAIGEEQPAVGRTALVVAREIRALQEEYAASFRTVRVRALPSDEWRAFEHKHKETLAKGAPYPDAMWDELIVKCAVAPAIPANKIGPFRKRVGSAAITEVSHACWQVNTTSGVQIPKSLLSSRVLRQREQETN